MKHPFWLLNTALLLLFISAMAFVFFSRSPVPPREDIEPAIASKPIMPSISQVNINQIYTKDLFGTYQRELPTTPADVVLAFPQPPTPQLPQLPQEPKPQFLDPLPITLKGIIIIIHDDSKNRAIIADNKTNQENAYYVGDKIEDAQLIRIMSNKIIFLRSNGQQEVLYLRERDAKLDPTFALIDQWDSVVHPITSTVYAINMAEFMQRVASLAQLIDMLDLTTVYKQGVSIGCRVGAIPPTSLGAALGLQKGDIITQINDIPATTTANRLKIYKEIISSSANSIKVTVTRDSYSIEFEYQLQMQPSKNKQAIHKAADEITKEQLKRLEQKETFAPTLQEIEARERRNMLEKGRRPSLNVLSNLTE
jgi:type II secretion system protein C